MISIEEKRMGKKQIKGIRAIRWLCVCVCVDLRGQFKSEDCIQERGKGKRKPRLSVEAKKSKIARKLRAPDFRQNQSRKRRKRERARQRGGRKRERGPERGKHGRGEGEKRAEERKKKSGRQGWGGGDGGSGRTVAWWWWPSCQQSRVPVLQLQVQHSTAQHRTAQAPRNPGQERAIYSGCSGTVAIVTGLHRCIQAPALLSGSLLICSICPLARNITGAAVFILSAIVMPVSFTC